MAEKMENLNDFPMTSWKVETEGKAALTLIDAELCEERVEAVDLLLLLDVRVVLRDALQRQLVHQVDNDWILQTILWQTIRHDGKGRSKRINQK